MEEAEDAARGLGETPVSIFPFGEAEEARVGSGGTGALTVSSDTPNTTIDYWNSKNEVKLVVLGVDHFCLARIGERGERDFIACLNPKMGSRLPDECSKITHQKSKVRVTATDPGGVYAITCPSSKSAKQKLVFSGPFFRVSHWPENLRETCPSRHQSLLTFSFCPSLFRFLFEVYPGEREMFEWYCSTAGGDVPKETSLREEEARAFVPTPTKMEPTTSAPGLGSILKDPPNPTQIVAARMTSGGESGSVRLDPPPSATRNAGEGGGGSDRPPPIQRTLFAWDVDPPEDNDDDESGTPSSVRGGNVHFHGEPTPVG